MSYNQAHIAGIDLPLMQGFASGAMPVLFGWVEESRKQAERLDAQTESFESFPCVVTSLPSSLANGSHVLG